MSTSTVKNPYALDKNQVMTLHRLPEVIEARKALTMYKSADAGLARFRLTAMAAVGDISFNIFTAEKRHPTTNEFLAFWAGDPGVGQLVDNFVAVFAKAAAEMIERQDVSGPVAIMMKRDHALLLQDYRQRKDLAENEPEFVQLIESLPAVPVVFDIHTTWTGVDAVTGEVCDVVETHLLVE